MVTILTGRVPGYTQGFASPPSSLQSQNCQHCCLCLEMSPVSPCTALPKYNINRPEPECKTFVFGKTLVCTVARAPSELGMYAQGSLHRLATIKSRAVIQGRRKLWPCSSKPRKTEDEAHGTTLRLHHGNDGPGTHPRGPKSASDTGGWGWGDVPCPGRSGTTNSDATTAPSHSTAQRT